MNLQSVPIRHWFGFRAIEWIALPVLFAAVVLLHWRVFLIEGEGQKHLAGDILTKDYPARVELLREIRMFHFPQWDSTQFAGWPGLGNCEASPLYPLNLPLLLFWEGNRFPYLIFEWYVVLHLVLAGWGAVKLGQRVGLSNAGAMIAGLAYGCTGFFLAHRLHVNIIQTLCWFPWCWWALEGILGRRRPIDGFHLTLAFFMLFAGGHPQIACYVVILILLRTVQAVARTAVVPVGDPSNVEAQPLPPAVSSRIARGLPPVAAIVFAAALTAVQWLPFLHLVSQGERSPERYQGGAEYSLPPEELVDFVLPEVATPNVEDPVAGPLPYWGSEIFYVGIVTLLLGFAAMPLIRRGGASEAAAAMVVLGVLLSLGPATMAHDLLSLTIPGMTSVRASSRWMGAIALPLALAAGKGLDWIISRREQSPWPSWISIGLIVWVGILLLLTTIFGSIRISFESSSESAGRFLRVLVAAGLFTVLLVFWVWLRETRRIGAQTFVWGVGLLIWIDLSSHRLDADLRDGEAGYLADAKVERILAEPIRYRTKIFLNGGVDREHYSGAVFGFEELDGESPLKPMEAIRTMELTALQSTVENPLRVVPMNSHLLSLFGVRYLITDSTQIRGAWEYDREDGLWIHPQPLPRVRLVTDTLTLEPPPAGGTEDIERGLLSIQDFPARTTALFLDGNERPLVSKPRCVLGQTGIEYHGSLMIHSCANAGVWPQALIYVNGKQIGLNRNGYNIAIVDPQSGDVLQSGAFNLNEDFIVMNSATGEGRMDPMLPVHHQLADFIGKAPDDAMVIVAVKHESTNVMQSLALEAFRSCGSGMDLSKLFMAHAFVGRKGAPPGTALEVASVTEALILVTDNGSLYAEPRQNRNVFPVPIAGVPQQEWSPRFSIDHEGRRPLFYQIGGATVTIPIQVYSSTLDDTLPESAPRSDRASVIVGGMDYARNEAGYNLVAVDPMTWHVLASEAFNIAGDWDAPVGRVREGTPANRAMRSFIQRFPRGTLIAGAIRDEAANLLQPETVESLRSIGLKFDLQKRYRWTHAFIGWIGAQSGTGLEVAGGPELKSSAIVLQSVEREISEAERSRLAALIQGASLHVSGFDLSFLDKPLRFQQTDFSESRTRKFAMSELTTPDIAPASDRLDWTFAFDGPNRMICSGWTDREGWLVTSERYFPGWRVSIDGDEAVDRPAHRFFRAIHVDPGYHVVQWTYEMPGAVKGLAITIGAAIVLIGLGLFGLIAHLRGRNVIL